MCEANCKGDHTGHLCVLVSKKDFDGLRELTCCGFREEPLQSNASRRLTSSVPRPQRVICRPANTRLTVALNCSAV